MADMDNIKSLISLGEAMLSDIEHKNNMDSIGERYSELKTYVENEVKALNKSPKSEFVEVMYLPALEEFSTRLTAKKGTKTPGVIYDVLLDAIGILQWYESQQAET